MPGHAFRAPVRAARFPYRNRSLALFPAAFLEFAAELPWLGDRSFDDENAVVVIRKPAVNSRLKLTAPVVYCRIPFVNRIEWRRSLGASR